MSGDPRTDVTRLLDDLEAAHEEWSTNGLDVDTTNGEVWNVLFRRPRWMDADAVHRLVAEHNALPQLVAAVRAGLALADEWQRRATTLNAQAMALGPVEAGAQHAQAAQLWHTTARLIRAALAAPLAGQPTTDEEADR